MWRFNPRFTLFFAVLLDIAGQAGIMIFLLGMPEVIGISESRLNIYNQGSWFLLSCFLYTVFNWLFGSYTVLRWPSFRLVLLIQRLFLAAVTTVIVLAIFRWVLNPGEDVWLIYRRVQLAWMVPLTLWSFGIRLALRNGLFLAERPLLVFCGSDEEYNLVAKTWNELPRQPSLINISPANVNHFLNSFTRSTLIALSSREKDASLFYNFRDRLETVDPRRIEVVSSLRLLELQQDRLPPILLPKVWLSYGEIPWTTPLSVQVQLKRAADVLLALLLLCISFPVLFVSILLIWLYDRGPVFYTQVRSGWLGKPFVVYKLRTMLEQPLNTPARWTQKNDPRITPVGFWLRRLRIDELPQLWNVLNGTMSLIGPRPERPQHESFLESEIPHYCKRHWMRPGLSGWAQVNASYASSLEASELKLSYDLFYLKNFSLWLDLIILFKTVKTILKASGR